jgi:predicted Fe-Mo cluster-binding NifX family protein
VDKHTQMIGPIGDCACVIAGGMGRGAYAHISAAGLRPVVTTLRHIEEAALECASGRIVDHVESLH